MNWNLVLFILQNQEAETKRMRDELNDLRQQEMELEQKAGTSRHQAEHLDRRLTDIQEQIKQVNVSCI
jgi:predicted nuclease with TOPRIM domain